MNEQLRAPGPVEPRIPRIVMWAIGVVVVGVAVLCLLAAALFLLTPP